MYKTPRSMHSDYLSQRTTVHSEHDDAPLHCSPDAPTRIEQCFGDIGSRKQKLAGRPNTEGTGFATVKKITKNCGVVHLSCGRKSDAMAMPQVSQVCKSFYGFRSSRCDLLPNALAKCDQAPEGLEAIDY